STITLMPVPPEGETNTNLWEWSNGATTQNLQLQVQESVIYRVKYTNSYGVVSTQSFSVSVDGDCLPEILKPSISLYNVTYDDTTTIAAMPGTRVTLTLSPTYGGRGNIVWNTNATTWSTSILAGTSDKDYSATFTSKCGAVTAVTFHIHSTYVAPFYQVDGDPLQFGGAILVEKGSNLLLKPKSYKKGGDWIWSDGSTGDSLSLRNIQTGGHFWVKYTYNNVAYQLDYVIQVYEMNYAIAEGNYYVKDPDTYGYLTNDGTNLPVFTTKNDSDITSQIFTITKDGTRYKMTSTKGDGYINELGVFGTNPYYTSWNTYSFHHILNTNLYAVQNGGSSGTEYWSISNNRIVGRGDGIETLEGFPFELIPYYPTAAQTITNPLSLKIYPNPVTDQFVVELPNEVKSAQLMIFDLCGRVVKSVRCHQGKNKLNCSNLEPSVYLGTLITKQNKSSFKMIKIDR
ncbi:MAG TPA: T9SS type A sorting domain-containing protein, partial [Sunxiuqinia sp.]|nr:T9SS type A sorting domain-containing protein [Sunxiuqinia sp.]